MLLWPCTNLNRIHGRIMAGSKKGAQRAAAIIRWMQIINTNSHTSKIHMHTYTYTHIHSHTHIHTGVEFTEIWKLNVFKFNLLSAFNQILARIAFSAMFCALVFSIQLRLGFLCFYYYCYHCCCCCCCWIGVSWTFWIVCGALTYKMAAQPHVIGIRFQLKIPPHTQ